MNPTNGHAKPVTLSDPGFELSRDDWGRLVLVDEFGRRFDGVEPVRSFPISDPGRWVSLCDPTGRELAMVESIDDLPDEARRLLVEELGRSEFLPVIRRIVRVASSTIPAVWEVETDRGPTRFTLDGEESIRRIGGGRALIVDDRGLRYLVADVKTLDPASRRILERFL
jgi:hypothetical protein